VKRLGLASLLLLGGCSTFDQDFQGKWPARSADLFSNLLGSWEGSWRSDTNGHEGALRCIITRGDSAYNARYYATYTWCCIPFSFEYTVPMTAVAEGERRDGGAWKLRGDAELGCWIAGGLYEYEARVEGGEYVATYRSDFDRGVFRMKRVE
jgi:hypothetical protein